MGIAVTPSTGIEDLDTDRLLACLGEAETAERRAEPTKPEVALQWCVVHPATVETGPAVWGDAGLPGFDSEESLGGQGCPTLAFAPEPFAAALGVSTFSGMQLLADALDLAYATGLEDGEPSRAEDVPGVRRPSLAKTRLYLHLSLSDLLNLLDGLVAIGEAERLGPITTSMIKDWLGATRATIVPVLHLGDAPTAQGSVDEHDPPDDRREAVILRDRHCVFPWCTVDARACDLDHIESYVPPDEGGPSGQTAPAKLACLCRRHHNAKTSRRWRYVRNRDGTYTWHGPHALTYVVTPHGTTPIPRA
jgi:hypothetical protein